MLYHKRYRTIDPYLCLLQLGALQAPIAVNTVSFIPSESSLSDRVRCHSHSRKVTRDIAALDFLQNIPMLADLTVDNTTSSSNERHFECFSNSLKKENIAMPKDEYYDAKHTQRDTESNAGRRLPGNHATWVKVPAQFRYRLATKYCVSSAIVRRWEDVQNQRGLLESRIFFSSGGGYPVAVSAILKVSTNFVCF